MPKTATFFWVMIQFKVSILEVGGNMTIWGYQVFPDLSESCADESLRLWSLLEHGRKYV
jgi:hypothetical protein